MEYQLHDELARSLGPIARWGARGAINSGQNKIYKTPRGHIIDGPRALAFADNEGIVSLMDRESRYRIDSAYPAQSVVDDLSNVHLVYNSDQRASGPNAWVDIVSLLVDLQKCRFDFKNMAQFRYLDGTPNIGIGSGSRGEGLYVDRYFYNPLTRELDTVNDTPVPTSRNTVRVR